MKDCIRIGAPSGISYLLEIGGWTFLVTKITAYPMENLVHSISISIISLFFFMGDGLFKAISTQAATLIGKNKLNQFNQLLRSSFIIFLIIMAFMYIPLAYCPELLVGFFIQHTIDGVVQHQAYLSLFGAWFVLLLDGFAQIFASFLRAGGDTLTVLIINVVCAWTIALAPAIYLLHYYHIHVSVLWLYVFPSFCLCNWILLSLRYYSKKWIKLNLHHSSHSDKNHIS